MAADSNVTYIHLDGFVEMQKYRYVYFVIMFTAYLLIIFSNITIVVVVLLHQNLHQPMYIFIAALLLNSVLLSTNIYPKLLVDFLSKKQIISYPGCLLQCYLYYSLSSSEFLLLAVMAYDRYVSICKPLQYPVIMRRTVVFLLLVFAWVLPLCQIVVPLLINYHRKLCTFRLKGFFCNNTMNYLYCVSSRILFIYGTVALVDLVVVPMLFIIFTYANILIISCRSSKSVRSKATNTCLPHLLVLINYSCLIIYDITIVKLDGEFDRTARFLISLQTLVYNPLFNPIIYGLKMKEINQALKRLFRPVKHS
ncbi:olfactory receptor 11A1-like [Cynoglossus semilaevis]|uniref:olfactory receptor 11A1-like n=1 Tax=Cynoglossus semilaevis TaxID=244447 RepID=UPI0004955D5B|nr:olfactory receptor 11A1-like [Cynoglossus semilaevis]XP_024919525.1 olfactory receptor 11A1-like [Cynoglossus semilaevis]